MPDESSAEQIPAETRRKMLLWNFLPLAHVCGVVLTVWLLPGWWGFSGGLAFLYLAPPLLCRYLLAVHPLEGGTWRTDSPEFLTWWATAQTQAIFCRLPALEEILRLVPGLYSAWLRLWGAKIGALTYWAPGLQILDRTFLDFGDGVVTGAGARLNAHVLECENLHLAEIVIGHRCRIGGYSLLTAGCCVADGEFVHAFALLPPFSHWTAGRRTKPAIPRSGPPS